MHRLLEIGASNAVTVAVLAVGVFAFSRLYWRPALIHALWVLLLVKLLTPPLIDLPLPMGFLAENTRGTAIASRENSPAPAVVSKVSSASDSKSKPKMVATLPPLLPDEDGEAQPDLPSLEEDVFATNVQHARFDDESDAAIPPVVAEEHSRSESSPAHTPSRFLPLFGVGLSVWVWGLSGLWFVGAGLIAVLTVIRVRRFKRLLRYAYPASLEMEHDLAGLARQLGLRKPPALLMLPGVHSPMLWGFPRATVLFPAKLAQQLDGLSRETLLLHELAHYRRCDHWTRVLEMLATIIYWWHPCLWWMRREMRIAEEECCDGWVISRDPESRSIYARALITVMDFLAEVQPAVPPAASGIGNFQSTTKRLTAIMTEAPRQELSRWTRLAVVLIALPLLCLAPTLTTGESSASVPASTPSPQSSNETPPETPSAKPAVRFPEMVESGKFETVPISLDGQQEKIRALAYSTDGKRLVAAHGTANSTGSLRVWEVGTKRLIALIPEAKGFCGVHISPDGKQIASCSFHDQRIRIRDVDTKKILAQIRPDDAHTQVRFSPDGKWLATASMEGTLQLWDLDQVKIGQQPAVTPSKELAKLDFNLQCVEFFPDGKKVAAGGGPWQGGKFGFAGVWDIETGKQVAKMEGMPDAVLGLAVSPNGKHVATAGHDGQTRLWDAETGKSIKVLKRSNFPLEWVDYSPDGKWIATGSYDDKATVFDVAAGGQVALLEDHQGDVMSVRFSPDGRTLATGGQDQIIRLWDVTNWQVRDRLQMGFGKQGTASPVLAVACSPDGRLLATAHGDRSVAIRDLAARSVLHQLTSHEDLISSLAFSPDGKTLATGSYDHDIKLWDVATGKEKQTLSGHSNWVMSVAFSPDGKLLASSGYDKSARAWDVAQGKVVQQFTGHTASVRSVAFSEDGKRLATGSSDQTVKLWDVKTGREERTLKGHTGAIRSVAFQPNTNCLATAGEDTSVRLWNLATGTVQSVLQGHEKIVWSLAFSSSGSTLVSGGMDGEISVWDSKTGTRRQILRRHGDIVSGLAFIPQRDVLISVSYDMTTKQWSPVAAPLKEIAHRATGTGAAASFVAFTPDGKRLVTTNAQTGLCRIWDANSGKMVRELQTELGHVRSAALSPDGRWLAVALAEKPIRLWELASGKMQKEFAIKGKIYALEFSPDGKVLASAGTDRRTRVWNVETGKRLGETSQQSEELQALAFAPDGKHFVTASGNWTQSRQGEVKLWKTDTVQEVALLGRHRGRINAVEFTRDGSQLLAGTNVGGIVLVFDMERREKTAEWRLDATSSIMSLTLNREGNRFAIGRADGSVTLWDLKSQQKLLDYAGHHINRKTNTALVWDLAFSPDGRVLASAGYDEESHSLHLWPTSKTEPITVAWQNAE